MSTEIKETKTNILDIFRALGAIFKAKDYSSGDDEYTDKPTDNILLNAEKIVEALEKGQEEPINVVKKVKKEPSIPKDAQANLAEFSKTLKKAKKSNVKEKEENDGLGERE